MKDYQYYLFDLDGTLTDSFPGITRSVQYALDYYGIHVEDLNELRGFIGPPLAESFQKFYGFDPQKSIEAVEKYRERYNTVGVYENAVIPGIPEILKGLKARGKVLAVATSKPEPAALTVVRHFGLYPCLDAAVGSTPSNHAEKKSDVIREVFRRLNLSGEEQTRALMIGDREHDIFGARECGIDSLGAYIGFAEPGELERAGATYVAHDIKELTSLLLGVPSQ